MRKLFSLTPAEIDEMERLRHEAGYAYAFWQKVCEARGLDYTTVLTRAPDRTYDFSALPIGHGKYWCWPHPHQCPKRVTI